MNATYAHLPASLRTQGVAARTHLAMSQIKNIKLLLHVNFSASNGIHLAYGAIDQAGSSAADLTWL
ncbi:hypothetical protein [Pseudodesulfovibrio sp.]|uniref:hypothetical protein n=1 Tax=unclassified Pseudodesulfovibrio TaxID=2661612 RepID=UPI003AFF8810